MNQTENKKNNSSNSLVFGRWPQTISNRQRKIKIFLELFFDANGSDPEKVPAAKPREVSKKVFVKFFLTCGGAERNLEFNLVLFAQNLHFFLLLTRT